MNKNWIRGLRCRASEQLIAKPTSIKGTGGKSSGCAWKAIELTSGDLLHKMLAVVVSNLEVEGEYEFERRMFGSNRARGRGSGHGIGCAILETSLGRTEAVL